MPRPCPLVVRKLAARTSAMAVAVIAACGPSQAQTWQKSGTNDQTMARDSTECRELARDEALRRYPYRGGSMLGQQRDDNSRAVAEAGLFGNCMQARGYRRTSSP